MAVTPGVIVVKTRQGRAQEGDASSQAVADVVDELVGYSVPAGQWACPGAAGWRRVAVGVGSERRGQRSWRGSWRSGRVRGVAVHALARACASLARLGVARLGSVVHEIVEGHVEVTQGSV
jgi:hypothetical protein